MSHESYEINKLEIDDCDVTFSSIYEKPYVTDELLEIIKGAEILIIPIEDFRDNGGLVFPEETDKLYHYFTEKAKQHNINVEICSADEDFKELELHSECITIATILIHAGAFDMAINILSAYLYEKLSRYLANKRANINTKVNIIVEKRGQSKIVKYDGAIENFDSAMKSIDNHIFK